MFSVHIDCALVWIYFIECLQRVYLSACMFCQNDVCVCMGACINEHLYVSLMSYSIKAPILCVQLIARTSAAVCVFLTLAVRSIALHTNVSLRRPHP